MNNTHLLHLLQLASPSLPVGAYSYSEGLENLIENKIINSCDNLQNWLEAELRYGAIRLETAVMVRAYQSAQDGDLEKLCYWNRWLSAARETEELRSSSWQMGRSLIQLFVKLQPEIIPMRDVVGNPCNYAIAFAIAASHWQIDINSVLLAYLHSWASNLIIAGVKLIPLGQTAGQQLLLDLQPLIDNTSVEVMALKDEEMNCCSWGLSLASMAHQTQYTRLFRS
jgi:urease accessory protein